MSRTRPYPWGVTRPDRTVSRDARLADAGLAIAVALVIAVVIAADPAGRTSWGGYACAAAFGLLLLARRRLTRLVLAITILGIFGYYTLDLPPIGMVLPAVGALYSAAEMRRTPWAVGGATVLIAVASAYRMDGSEPDSALNGYTFVTEVALAAAAIALGAAVRLTREARERSRRIAELTAAEQAHAAEARLHDERMRMARDLHDTIGHALSVASLHAGVAAESTDAASTTAALDEVRAATSEALRELRRTVKVLRADRLQEPEPVAGLASAEALFAAARGAGLEVDAEVTDEPLPAAVDTAAYRIVQESLTNVLRHAGASRVTVSARVDEGSLVLQVTDDGRERAAGGGGGAGIRGMRERAELLGGSLTAGHAATGFVVDARIPVDTAAAAGEERA